MGSRIAGVLVLIALCIGAYFLWQHHQLLKQETDGEVHCTGCMTPEEKARFAKENSGDTPDGDSEHKERSAQQDAIMGSQNTPVNGAATTATATQADSTTVPAATTTVPAPTAAPAAPYQPPAASYSMTNGSTGGAPPASDTQPPNAANGVRFGGSGHYEWYRQGNLTWRLDPQSGGSCIAFATLEEWRKQIVYSHGCGRGA